MYQIQLEETSNVLLPIDFLEFVKRFLDVDAYTTCLCLVLRMHRDNTSYHYRKLETLCW